MQGQVQEAGKKCWHYARLGCKRWPCPRCGPKKAKRLRRAMTDWATQKSLRRFLTLTLNPASCQPAGSVSYIKQCWNKFRTYLKRRYRVPISYMAIVELQKSGYAHLHILVDRYIEQQWISEAWQAIGGGKIAFITYVDIHRIASYLTKYLTKDLLSEGFRPRQRRYSTSRDIHLFPHRADGTWMIIKAPVDYLRSQAGHRVTEENHDEEGVLRWFRIPTSLWGAVGPLIPGFRGQYAL